MYDSIKRLIDDSQKIVIIQPENPDGDSLATSLALEEILCNLDKEVTLFCAIDMPKYLRYIEGWDRVQNDWTGQYDSALIVDTTADALLQKALSLNGVRHFLETHAAIVIDHHSDEEGADDLSFPHESITDSSAAATSQLVYKIAQELGWPINKETATNMFISISADTLGLSTPSTSLSTFETVTELVRAGAEPSLIEQARREYMRKPADILEYKGELIGRIQYLVDGRLALVHIPWEDIEAYSDRYNPSILVLDEMRLVEGVDVAIAIKTYPDGKLTGKLRSNTPVAQTIAGYFGGGGHPYSAGFKVYETYDNIVKELVNATLKALDK